MLTADERAALWNGGAGLAYGVAPPPVDAPVWHCAIQSAATQVADGQAAFFMRGRYHPGITIETQLNFEGRTFQVQGVTDLDERHVELQLLCVEVVGRAGPPAH